MILLFIIFYCLSFSFVGTSNTNPIFFDNKLNVNEVTDIDGKVEDLNRVQTTYFPYSAPYCYVNSIAFGSLSYPNVSYHKFIASSAGIYSSYHITTGGNSGGPLFYNNVYVENGVVIHTSYVVGICSSGNNDNDFYFAKSDVFLVTLLEVLMSE